MQQRDRDAEITAKTSAAKRKTFKTPSKTAAVVQKLHHGFTYRWDLMLRYKKIGQ